ncbi:MAG: helix-turn-helix transcriptional regulator [Bacteroidota bacterium]
MKKIELIVERTNTGYSAYTKSYPIATTGKDLVELKSNMIDAINLYFEEKGQFVCEDDLKVTLDIAQFFAFYKVINTKVFSERIGMSQSLLAQYIKGNKKPSPLQTKRILKGVQQIGKELAEISFLL